MPLSKRLSSWYLKRLSLKVWLIYSLPLDWKSPMSQFSPMNSLLTYKTCPIKTWQLNFWKDYLAVKFKTRSQKNVVQSRSFAEMLERSIRAYQNRTIEAAQVIEKLIEIAREMRQAQDRGDALGLSEEELAFYDALETNDSAVEVLGDETLKTIAIELVETVRKSVTIDWTIKESVVQK